MRATSPDVTVFDGAAEGIDGPLGAIDADDVQVSNEKKGLRRIGNRSGAETSNDGATAGSEIENLGRDAFLGENAGDVFGDGFFVAGGICGIDPNEVREPGFGFLRKSVGVC